MPKRKLRVSGDVIDPSSTVKVDIVGITDQKPPQPIGGTADSKMATVSADGAWLVKFPNLLAHTRYRTTVTITSSTGAKDILHRAHGKTGS